MVYSLRSAGGHVEVVEDLHVCGLFAQADWLRLLAETGFQAKMLPFEHSELEPDSTHVFVGVKA